LLVKGSRGVRMEAIVEALRARHAPKRSGTGQPPVPAGDHGQD
jgi:hypothetical protein